MKTSHFVCLVASTVGAASSIASAQVQWETRVRYLVNGVPVTSLVVPDEPIQITVQAGIFNVTGLGPNQANHGLNMWTGIITSTAPGLAVDSATARIPPYNFGPATSFGGVVLGGGTRIEGGPPAGTAIYAARAIAPSEPVPWLNGQPAPTGPADFGVDSYVSVYRFTFNMGEQAGGGTTITATGSGGPIIRWVPFTEQPPEGGQDGYVTFAGVSPPSILQPYTPATLTLIRVPSPAGAGAVLLGVAAAGRRRRGGR